MPVGRSEQEMHGQAGTAAEQIMDAIAVRALGEDGMRERDQ